MASNGFEWCDPEDLEEPVLGKASNGENHATIYNPRKKTEWLTVPNSIWIEVAQ